MANSSSSSSSSSSESSSSSSSCSSSSSSDYSRRGDRRLRHSRNRERENERVAEEGRDRIRANPAHPPGAMDQPLPVNAGEQPAAAGEGLDGQQGPVEAQLNRVARESSRKKVRPSKRESKKLVKRLRKGVSNKRVSKVKKRYSVSFSDKLG